MSRRLRHVATQQEIGSLRRHVMSRHKHHRRPQGGRNICPIWCRGVGVIALGREVFVVCRRRPTTIASTHYTTYGTIVPHYHSGSQEGPAHFLRMYLNGFKLLNPKPPYFSKMIDCAKRGIHSDEQKKCSVSESVL